MKKGKFQKINKKFFTVIGVFTVGFVFTNITTLISKNVYESNRNNLENVLRRNLNKDFDLGEFSGLRFLGFSLLNTKIEDIAEKDSTIEAKGVYVRFMPIRSIVNRELSFSLNPNKLKVDIKENFFLRKQVLSRNKLSKKRKFNYEVHLNLKDKSKLTIYDLGIQGNFRGNLVYRSKNNQLITLIKTYLKEKGNLKIELNKKFNNQFLSLNLKSDDLDLKNYKYKFLNKEFKFKKGNFKSNFKFVKSPNNTYCKGQILINNVNLLNINLNENIKSKLINLNENIKSKSINLNCIDNKFMIRGDKLNYAALNSNLEIDVPLNNGENNINFKQNIVFDDDPIINIKGTLPYRIKERGFDFGNLSANINLDEVNLAEFNFLRNKGFAGFMTAQGKLSGELKNINTLIDFQITYPTYKGVKIKETFDGKFENQDKGYLLKLLPRESVIPTYVSVKFDRDFELDNLNVQRVLHPEKGDLKIFKKNDAYLWEVDKFALKKLELSILDNNNYEWVEGEINGSGFISSDLSNFNGNISLNNGKYRNINLKKSNIKFEQNGNSLNLESNLQTGDGGKINIIYDSNSNDRIKAKLNNVSSDWTAITVFDVIDFQRNNSRPEKSSNNFYDENLKNQNTRSKKGLKVFNALEIIHKGKTFKERVDILKNLYVNDEISNKQSRVNDFIEKFNGRYDGEIILTGTDRSNYEIAANLYGYIKEKNDLEENTKNNFSVDLKGGLMENEGKLISKLPLNIANLFFKEPKKFSGNLGFILDYDLNKKSFLSNISSNELFFEGLNINIQKADIKFKDSNLTIDSSLLIDKKGNPITIEGEIPFKKIDKEKNNKIKELDLRLDGNEKFLELIANLSGNNFNFEDGEVNFNIIFQGSIDKPIAYGFLKIDNGEIEVLKNNLKNLQTRITVQKKLFAVDYFTALGDDSGELSIEGSIPFYNDIQVKNKGLEFNTKNLKFKRNNIDLIVDSDILIAGSIGNPKIGGDFALKNGLIDFKGNENKSNNESKNKKEKDKQNFNSWPEVNWAREKEIEIITNGSLSADQIGLDLGKIIREKTPEFFSNSIFENFNIRLGPDFRIGYANFFGAYLDNSQEEKALLINGNPKSSSLDKNGINAYGDINIIKGYANLYTTPFKLDKKPYKKKDLNKVQKQIPDQRPNSIRFLPNNGVNPRLNFYLISKVPDSIIPISDNNLDINISEDSESQESINDFGSFGIGNTRFIKVEAFYDGLLNQLSFEDQNQYLKLRSTPSYNRAQIIRLISGNSANIINRIFTSQLSGSGGFNERFQLSLYPALIEDNESINNIFSSDKIDPDNQDENTDNDGSSSQAWIAELGLDITNSLNFAIQATPDREDIPPLWILTLQANQYLELLGSFDSNGDWKSQLQLFFRY